MIIIIQLLDYHTIAKIHSTTLILQCTLQEPLYNNNPSTRDLRN